MCANKGLNFLCLWHKCIISVIRILALMTVVKVLFFANNSKTDYIDSHVLATHRTDFNRSTNHFSGLKRLKSLGIIS